MALSKTHILTSVMALISSGKYVFPETIPSEILAYAVIPDAIRCFYYGDGVKNSRVVSHYEVHPVTGVASSMVFPNPDELKVLNDSMVQEKIVHVEGDYNQVALGDVSNIGVFFQLNAGLPELEFKGILNHLTQDAVYDNYVRTLIDISQKKEGKFIYTVTGEVYDATSVRKLIGAIEQQEFRYLAELFEETTGLDTKEYFESVVFPAIRNAFCEKMAETTIKYINLNDDGVEVAPNEVCKKIVDEMIAASVKTW